MVKSQSSIHSSGNNKSVTDGKRISSQLDSGLFSMDGVLLQPAKQRIAFNNHRIDLLSSINSVLAERGLCEERAKELRGKLKQLKETVASKEQQVSPTTPTLTNTSNNSSTPNSLDRYNACASTVHMPANLPDSLKLSVQVLIYFFEHIAKSRKDHANGLRLAGQSLEGEHSTLSHQVDHARSHLEGVIHVHQHCHIPAQCVPCSGRGGANAPSKKANNKIAAQRLIKEIAELQQRVCSVEMRLHAENKIKHEIESEIRRLRAELCECRKKRVCHKTLLPPLTKVSVK